MASSTREVLITIRLEEGSPITPNKQRVPEELKGDKEKTLAAILVHQGLNVSKDLIAQGVSSTMNRYTSMKENYLAEQMYQNTVSAIGKATQLGSAVASGYLLGGMPGAIISAVGVGVGEILSLQNKYSGHFRNLNASNMGVDFARTRAGLIDNGRGTEN